MTRSAQRRRGPPSMMRRRGGDDPKYSYLTGLGSLVAAWDFALGVTPVSGGVDSILDQSGRGNTLSAPAAANRPTYNASDADFNGQPCGEGNGTAHYLRDTAISMGAAWSPGSLIIVAKMVTNTSNEAWLSLSIATQIRESTTNRVNVVTGTGSFTTTTTFNTRAHVLGVSAAGSSFQVYVDGVAEGSPTAYTGTVADASPVALFARSDSIVPANVKIAFAAVSLTVLTAQQHADFATYARARWGTP